MTKKFHITIKDNEDGAVYMDDDVAGILGAVIMGEEHTRGILQMPSTVQDTLAKSEIAAILNANCVKAAILAIKKLMEKDQLTRIAYMRISEEPFDQTVKIDFDAIKKAREAKNGTDKKHTD